LRCGACIAPVAPPPTTKLEQPTPRIDVNSSALYEVIAGIALIITGLFLGYDELWGGLMILLGVLVIFFWVARMGWML
jgi:Flp pilus assembly protein TadB